jgi:hypothetical protein
MQIRPCFAWRLGPLIIMIVALSGCGVGQNQNTTLRVPFRPQDSADYCTAACIQMWQAYNGVPETPQQVIYNFYGGSSGAKDMQAWAVNYYAFGGGGDVAYIMDFADLPNETGDDMWRRSCAKEITSIDSNTPVIALIRHGIHSTVIDGGHWHPEGDKYMWDSLYVHDPSHFSGDDYYDPIIWRSELDGGRNLVEHIMSSSASANWLVNYGSYGGSLWDPTDPKNPEMQIP